MSIAAMPRRASTSRRIASLHGSAPKRPIARALLRKSTPRCSATSAIASAYEGVAQRTRAPKSLMSATCRSVEPPDIGTTTAPRCSAP